MKIEITYDNGKTLTITPPEEPVVKEQPKHQYKIGDKVRIVGSVWNDIAVGDIATISKIDNTEIPLYLTSPQWKRNIWARTIRVEPYTEPKLRQPPVTEGMWVEVLTNPCKERVGHIGCVTNVSDSLNLIIYKIANDNHGYTLNIGKYYNEWRIIPAPLYPETGTLWYKANSKSVTITQRYYSNNQWWYVVDYGYCHPETVFTDVCPVKFRVGEKVKHINTGVCVAWDERNPGMRCNPNNYESAPLVPGDLVLLAGKVPVVVSELMSVEFCSSDDNYYYLGHLSVDVDSKKASIV